MLYGIIINCERGFKGSKWIIQAAGKEYLKDEDGSFLEFAFPTKKEMTDAAEKINNLSLNNFTIVMIKNSNRGTAPVVL